MNLFDELFRPASPALRTHLQIKYSADEFNTSDDSSRVKVREKNLVIESPENTHSTGRIPVFSHTLQKFGQAVERIYRDI